MKIYLVRSKYPKITTCYFREENMLAHVRNDLGQNLAQEFTIADEPYPIHPLPNENVFSFVARAARVTREEAKQYLYQLGYQPFVESPLERVKQQFHKGRMTKNVYVDPADLEAVIRLAERAREES